MTHEYPPNLPRLDGATSCAVKSAAAASERRREVAEGDRERAARWRS
jgi:hypothetical protein